MWAKKTMQFDFGKNWVDFSKNALTAEKVKQAKQDFEKLFDHIELKGKTFADIGFGQGLGLLIAKQKGATVVGCEINPTCEEALKHTLVYFPEFELTDILWVNGSILSQDTLEQVSACSKKQGFDIVHSWGVLCLTGEMRKSIENTATLVKSEGYLVISIYNRHWTSPIWLFIKWFYNKLPAFMQKWMVYLFYPIIWLAKYAVTGENPKKMSRGMDFFYNVVDWIGGYPYEYASKDEIVQLLEPLGFMLVHLVPAQVPTGCNEFVFRKN